MSRGVGPAAARLKPGVAVRVAAARVLARVLYDRRPLDDALDDALNETANKTSTVQTITIPAQDRPLLQELCYGVLRWQPRLAAVIAYLSDRPVAALDPTARVLILLGLYQLKHTRIPDHAAIDATVESTAALKNPRYKGFINAVLRQYQRRRDECDAALDNAAGLAARYAHPKWILRRLQQDWPDDWQAIAHANNARAPLTLRIDTATVARADYLARLAAKSIAAAAHPVCDTAVTLARPTDVESLPGFAQGIVSAQDAAAQLAAPLVRAESHDRVLDACAAPGGKTAQILQQSRPAEVVALDSNKKRLALLRQTLKRVRREAKIIHADAAAPPKWWDGRPFESILLDAPCTASGVIRRHPDIKHLRTPAALKRATALQEKILAALWQTLKPGGRMVYVTCSVFAQENEDQISRFLSRHADACLAPPPGDWGRGVVGRQILPGEADMDGFYFAVLVKEG